MPTIAIRPTVGDHDDPHETTTGPRRTLALRLKVAVKGDALLRELAAGAPPLQSPELALRASKLVNDRHPTRSSISIVDRSAVIDADVAIQALIARLSSHERVAPQGVAMVERLITDAVASPMYNQSGPGALRRQLLAATAALELESDHGEFPLAA